MARGKSKEPRQRKLVRILRQQPLFGRNSDAPLPFNGVVLDDDPQMDFDPLESRSEEAQDLRKSTPIERRAVEELGDLLLTTEEAAEYIGFSAETLHRWRMQGKYLPFVKFGSGKGHIRYLLGHLQKFILGSLRRSTSETTALNCIDSSAPERGRRRPAPRRRR